MITFAWVCLGCAIAPALLYLWNSFLFREPPEFGVGPRVSPISVLIPARNEEIGIATCVESVLATRDIDLEVIVLDDHSTDRTADIIREIATKDSRLRLETAPPLPEGWCGKQHACLTLSKLAKYDLFAFLDADVRLEPNALARMVQFLDQSGAALVSGFPRQETGTFLEKLLIPLIHWLLLSWLPLWGMRHFRWSAFGAGCGQWFMTTREPYEKVGGHAAVKLSFHDGLTLPRAYRKAGYFTDICDTTNLATCRMYRSASAVWNGLAKNAREGMASNGQVAFWTVVLVIGQVAPFVMLAVCLGFWAGHKLPSPEPLAAQLLATAEADLTALRIAAAACLTAFLPRLHSARRYRQSWQSVCLHPFGVIALLAIQWYAIFRVVVGRPVGWKGRTHSSLSSAYTSAPPDDGTQ